MTKPPLSRPLRLMRSPFVWGVCLIVLALVGYVYLRDRGAPDTSHLLTTKVVRGTVETSVLATGTLKPKSWVAVGAQVSGQIKALNVKLGDTVKAGDVVAEIDSITQENALKSDEAALQNVRAQLQEKQATLLYYQQMLARYQGLLSKGVTQADMETAQMDLATTEAQIAALEAQITEAEVTVSTAKANLGYTRIASPIDGTIIAVVSQQGQTVNATQTTPTIVIVAQLGTMTVRANIAETDVVHVQPGQDAWFTILGDRQHRYKAKLQDIEPAPEDVKDDTSLTSSTSASSSSSSSTSDSAIYYVGTFDVPNPDGRLLTYMTTEVHIITGAARNVLTVPSSAVSGTGKDTTVSVLTPDGRIEPRKVTLGLDNETVAEVSAGLSEGDTIVLGQAPAGGSTMGNFRGPMGPMGAPMGRR